MIKQNCQVCGKPFYRKPSQVGNFCSYKCKYESQRTIKPRICPICNKEFIPANRNDSAKFCSRKCLDKHNVGENNPNWKGGEVEKVCANCGNHFTVRKHFALFARFCSKECKYAHGWVTVICTNCNKSFQVQRSVKENGRKFCSQKCNKTYLVGEKHFAWRGGDDLYPATFNENFRTQVRNRDNYTCKVCGKHGNSVHHINYRKDDTTPENCITLCNSCHSKTNSNRDYWMQYFASW